MDESERRLKENLRLVEARFAGLTADEGLDSAAGRRRMISRLAELRTEEAIGAKFSPQDSSSRRLLIALAKRYGLEAYRPARQGRRLTVVINGPESFIRDVLLPEYNAMAEMLYEHLDAIAERVVSEVLSGGLVAGDRPEIIGDVDGDDEDDGE